MNLKVSVIIPVYNCEDYLERCISSVCGQNFKELEVIVIDDGSTDNSAKVIKRLSKLYTNICLYSTENRGVSAARNLGIKKARGEFILFLDADDYLVENSINSLYSAAKKNNVLLVFGGFRYTDEKAKEIINDHREIEKYYMESEEFLHDMLQNKVPRTSSGILFNRNKIVNDNISFSKTLKYGEDFLFTLKFLKAIEKESIVILDGQFYCVERRENSASRRNDFSHLEGVIKLEKELTVLLKETKYSNSIIKLFQDEILLTIEKMLYSKSNFKDKKDNLQKVKASEIYKKYIIKVNEVKVNKKRAIKLCMFNNYPIHLLIYIYMLKARRIW